VVNPWSVILLAWGGIALFMLGYQVARVDARKWRKKAQDFAAEVVKEGEP